MRKQLVTLAVIGLLFSASQGLALTPTINYSGNYTISDLIGGDSFSETLKFDNPFGPHSGAIGSFFPVTDGLFSDGGIETVLIADLLLDKTVDGSGGFFQFSPTGYAAGFKIFDDDGTTLLLTADLTVDRLNIIASTGNINPSLTLNLTSITAGPGYVPGSSTIIDAFLDPTIPGGVSNFTLNLTGGFSGINLGNTLSGSYSGSASPVPEPGTLLLLGFGLVGVGVYGRTRRKS